MVSNPKSFAKITLDILKNQNWQGNYSSEKAKDESINNTQKDESIKNTQKDEMKRRKR